MVKTKTSWFREHFPAIAVGLLMAALLYAVPATYRNHVALERQSEVIKEVQDELKSMKQSFVAVILDKNTDKTKAIQDLVSDARTLEGAKHFAGGQYEKAYAIWRPAAKQGNRDAQAAIAVADAALRHNALNVNLPLNERRRAATAAGVALDLPLQPESRPEQ